MLGLICGVVDTENEGVPSEPKSAKETIDIKVVKRMDHISYSQLNY